MKERTRPDDRPEWVRDVIGGMRNDIAELKIDLKKLTDMEIRYARCHETMARYGNTIDDHTQKIHQIELDYLGSRVITTRNDKLLWSLVGGIGTAFMGLAVWVLTHPGMFLRQ